MIFFFLFVLGKVFTTATCSKHTQKCTCTKYLVKMSFEHSERPDDDITASKKINEAKLSYVVQKKNPLTKPEHRSGKS